MTTQLDGREVELEIDSNRDGSKFFAAGYFTDNNADLTDSELDKLQDEHDGDEELNGNWRG
jgi:hypothetical protein